MTLPEKLGELVLDTSGSYENVNAGVARLCIPSLTLSDGPWGLAFGDTGVTLLPAPLAIGATFDTVAGRAVRRGDRQRGPRPGDRRQPGPEPQHRPGPPVGPGRRVLRGGPAPHHRRSAWPTSRGLQAQGVMADAKHLARLPAGDQPGRRSTTRCPPGRCRRSTCPPFKAAVTQGARGHPDVRLPPAERRLPVPGPRPRPDPRPVGLRRVRALRPGRRPRHRRRPSPRGVDLLKPSSVDELTDLMVGPGAAHPGHRRRRRRAGPDPDVRLRHSSAGRPPARPGTPVATAGHAAFALTAAERSAVLLQNTGHAPAPDPDLAPLGGRHRRRRLDPPGDPGLRLLPRGRPRSSPPRWTRSGRGSARVDRRATPRAASTTRHLPTVPTRTSPRPRATDTASPSPSARRRAAAPAITTVDPVPAAAIEPAPELPCHGTTTRSAPTRRRTGRTGSRRTTPTAAGSPTSTPTASGATSIELPDRAGPGPGRRGRARSPRPGRAGTRSRWPAPARRR